MLLRFSLKESLYKSIHPLICQYVTFQEAEVQPLEDGTAVVQWHLASGAHERFGSVVAHWRRWENYFVTSSCASILPSTDCDNATMAISLSSIAAATATTLDHSV